MHALDPQFPGKLLEFAGTAHISEDKPALEWLSHALVDCFMWKHADEAREAEIFGSGIGVGVWAQPRLQSSTTSSHRISDFAAVAIDKRTSKKLFYIYLYEIKRPLIRVNNLDALREVIRNRDMESYRADYENLFDGKLWKQMAHQAKNAFLENPEQVVLPVFSSAGLLGSVVFFTNNNHPDYEEAIARFARFDDIWTWRQRVNNLVQEQCAADMTTVMNTLSHKKRWSGLTDEERDTRMHIFEETMNANRDHETQGFVLYHGFDLFDLEEDGMGLLPSAWMQFALDIACQVHTQYSDHPIPQGKFFSTIGVAPPVMSASAVWNTIFRASMPYTQYDLQKEQDALLESTYRSKAASSQASSRKSSRRSSIHEDRQVGTSVHGEETVDADEPEDPPSGLRRTTRQHVQAKPRQARLSLFVGKLPATRRTPAKLGKGRRNTATTRGKEKQRAMPEDDNTSRNEPEEDEEAGNGEEEEEKASDLEDEDESEQDDEEHESEYSDEEDVSN